MPASSCWHTSAGAPASGRADQPSGMRRSRSDGVRLLFVRGFAAKTVLAPKTRRFARDYPDVESTSRPMTAASTLSAGFDAGIQFGEYIAQEMVAVRVSPDLSPRSSAHRRIRRARQGGDHRATCCNIRCIGFRHRGGRASIGGIRQRQPVAGDLRQRLADCR